MTLKPLTDRKEKLRLINALMSEFQNKYEGRIAGMGTHGELLRDCEAYREIARSQLSEAELEGGAAK